jgi:hypothetical protein
MGYFSENVGFDFVRFLEEIPIGVFLSFGISWVAPSRKHRLVFKLAFWLLILTFTLLIEIEKKKQALKNEVSWICVRHSYC